MKKQKLQRKVGHELREFLTVFLFLVPFLFSFTAYGIYVAQEFGASSFHYGIAVVNALVLSKVILIGEVAGLGRQLEKKPLLISTLYKSAVFTIFFLAFHILENILHGCIHGRPLAGALNAELVFGKAKLLSLTAVIFLAFIPFFALREIRRVLGDDQFRHLFFG